LLRRRPTLLLVAAFALRGPVEGLRPSRGNISVANTVAALFLFALAASFLTVSWDQQGQ
jgi:hypothetical protein